MLMQGVSKVRPQAREICFVSSALFRWNRSSCAASASMDMRSNRSMRQLTSTGMTPHCRRTSLTRWAAEKSNRSNSSSSCAISLSIWDVVPN